MREVLFLKEAEKELVEAVAYYEGIYAGLGLDLESNVKERIIDIAHDPDIWALRDDGTRRCSTRRFPYQIVYFVHVGVVWIVAVAHHKRFQEYWGGRLNSEQLR